MYHKQYKNILLSGFLLFFSFVSFQIVHAADDACYNFPADTGNTYANLSDNYEYTYVLTDYFGNIIKNKKVTSLGCADCKLKDLDGALATEVPQTLVKDLDANGVGKFSVIAGSNGNSYPNMVGALRKWEQDDSPIVGKEVDFSLGGTVGKNFSKPLQISGIDIVNVANKCSNSQCYATDGFVRLKVNFSILGGVNPTKVTEILLAITDTNGRSGSCTFSSANQPYASSITFNCDPSGIDFTKDGTYSFVAKAKYKYNNYIDQSDELTIPNKLEINPTPFGFNSIDQALVSDAILEDAYGNYKDKYDYTLELKDRFGNILKPKGGKFRSVTDLTCLDNTVGICRSTKAVDTFGSIETFNYTGNIDQNGKKAFIIRSAVPGDFTPKFTGAIANWTPDYKSKVGKVSFKVQTSALKTFKDPIVWDKFEAEGGGIQTSETQQKFYIQLDNEGKLTDTFFSLGKLITQGKTSIYQTSFPFSDTAYNWNTFVAYPNVAFSSGLRPYFRSVVKVTDDTKLTGNDVSITPQDLRITYSYKAGSRNYRINYPFNNVTDVNSCAYNGRVGVKVEGFSEGIGKVDETSQEQEFTDVSSSELRSQIRKNAYILLRNLPKNRKTQTIHYYTVNKNISSLLSSIQANDTIIIENANLTIDKEIPADKKVGIIVLSNTYDVQSNNAKGNVYIKNDLNPAMTDESNVDYPDTIHAVIYADGAITRQAVTPRLDDDKLRKPLVINGSIFTRNTIGGGLAGSSGCILPGKKPGSCDLAKKYDLNMLRTTFICSEGDYSLKVKYDSALQINPPRGFEN